MKFEIKKTTSRPYQKKFAKTAEKDEDIGFFFYRRFPMFFNKTVVICEEFEI